MATAGQGITRLPGAMLRCTAVIPLTVTAIANTDFNFQLPCAARNLVFRTKTVTAFGAATDAQLQLGKTVGGAEYVAAVSVKAQGEVAHAEVAAGIPDLDQVPGSLGSTAAFTGRIVQSGAASAVGVATLYVDYSIPV